MRPTRFAKTLTAPAALGLALAAAVVTAAPARAADDDPSFETKILRSMMESLGLKREGGPTINYQERGPLVLPPNADLPPPQKGDVATTNPAWPRDPDLAAAKQAEIDRNRSVSSEDIERESRPLRPDQLIPNKKERSASRTNNKNAPPTDPNHPELSPAQLGYKGGLFSNMFGSDDSTVANTRFTGEPVRDTLTDPPAGYRTPSPGQPYGLGKEKAAPTAAADPYVDHGTQDR